MFSFLVTRKDTVSNLNAMPDNVLRTLFTRSAAASQRLVAVVAGTGQIARCAVEASADMLFVLNAGTYRTAGLGSLASFLAYGNANQQTLRSVREQVMPAAENLPVVAGVLAGDPTLRLEELLVTLQALGVSGVTNWPAVGFIDGSLRTAMEAEGVGVDGEIEMLKTAARYNLATVGFALDVDSAAKFAAAGVDGLILNLGLTREIADVHERRDQLQQALVQLRAMQAAVRRTGREPFMLAFGGPATTADDLEQIFRHADVGGYAGGSVFERLPVHESVTATISHFKSSATQPIANNKGIGLGEMIGQSAGLQKLFELIRRVAPRDVNLVIEGESGTGKELVATLLHRFSPRSPHAFVTLNCGAITETLLESELFGHEKGAFTGAHRRRLGKFELAHHGTLFLDEIADLSPHAQVALLRVLQQREITRVGGETTIPVDTRILSASNQNLEERVASGHFREDLYYRLNGMTLKIPPLRSRPDDIPLLANATVKRLCIQWNLPKKRLSASFLARLARHSWPGNVRELQQVLGQAILLEDGVVIEGRHFIPARPRVAANGATSDVASRGLVRERAEQALIEADGNKSRAAAALGVTRKTLYAWLAAH